MTILQVKMSTETNTPAPSCLDVGATGDWILGRDNVDGITTVQMYDEANNMMYASKVIGIVEVPTEERRSRYRVMFDKDNVITHSINYQEKGFEFSGHGVAYSD